MPIGTPAHPVPDLLGIGADALKAQQRHQDGESGIKRPWWVVLVRHWASEGRRACAGWIMATDCRMTGMLIGSRIKQAQPGIRLIENRISRQLRARQNGDFREIARLPISLVNGAPDCCGPSKSPAWQPRPRGETARQGAGVSGGGHG